MRRHDREVTDQDRIEAIIQSCECCRIGLVEDGKAYIVPLSFAYVQEEGRGCFYFHGASEGRKLTIIRENPHAGFELDTNYKLHPNDKACGYSCRFQSVIGSGRISMVDEDGEKRNGLAAIMEHYSGKSDWEFDSRMVDAVTVLRLDVEELCCKEHE